MRGQLIRHYRQCFPLCTLSEGQHKYASTRLRRKELRRKHQKHFENDVPDRSPADSVVLLERDRVKMPSNAWKRNFRLLPGVCNNKLAMKYHKQSSLWLKPSWATFSTSCASSEIPLSSSFCSISWFVGDWSTTSNRGPLYCRSLQDAMRPILDEHYQYLSLSFFYKDERLSSCCALQIYAAESNLMSKRSMVEESFADPLASLVRHQALQRRDSWQRSVWCHFTTFPSSRWRLPTARNHSRLRMHTNSEHLWSQVYQKQESTCYQALALKAILWRTFRWCITRLEIMEMFSAASNSYKGLSALDGQGLCDLYLRRSQSFCLQLVGHRLPPSGRGWSAEARFNAFKHDMCRFQALCPLWLSSSFLTCSPSQVHTISCRSLTM